MDKARWQRLQDLFHEAIALSGSERRPWLERACGGDARLLSDALSMLEEDERADSVLDRGVDGIAHQVIDASPVAGLPPDAFAPYRVTGVLGEGGMGIVYRAERADLESVVAIKVLRDAWLSPSRRDRFAVEQRTLGRLNHPSIARIYDASTLPDGTPWFVMEYVEGVSLTTYCSTRNSSIVERLKLFREVCAAVQYAHQQQVVHRDLKPSNILVTDQGSVKLLDFGIAKPLDATERGIDHTGTGLQLMTPAYAAPERIRGGAAGVETDVFSLGVVLYELLAGCLPFDFSNRTPAEVERLLVGGTVEKPSTVAKLQRPEAAGHARQTTTGAAWTDLDVLCLTAMHKDPARRYPTVDALIQDTDRFLEGEPLVARPEAIGYRAAKFLTRNRRLLSASALGAIVVAVVAALVAVTVSRRFEQRSPPAEQVRTVAVLPFENVGADASLDFLQLALADEVATTLSHVRGLAVRPFAATSKYAAPGLDLKNAARELGVTHVLTGRFLKIGTELNITLEAIDVEHDRSLWRDTINSPAHSLVAAQLQMTLRVRGGLAPALGGSPTEGGSPPKNEEAYQLFLRSAALTFEPAPNPEGIAMLEKSLELDPGYAPAWVSLARRFYTEARYGGGTPALMARYEAAMERAAALDPNDAAAAAGLIVSRVERGDLVGAYGKAEALVRRRPNSVDAHFISSYVLRYAGLLEEAGDHCETALLLDPHTVTSGLRSCAVVFLLRSDYPRALNYLSLDRGSDWAKAISIHMLLRQNKPREAVQLGSPNIAQWNSWDLALACARRGPSTEIESRAAAVRASEDPEANYFAAAHLAYCDRRAEALEMLGRAIRGGYCSYPAIDSDPLFATVRTTSEFASVRALAMACRDSFQTARGRSAYR